MISLRRWLAGSGGKVLLVIFVAALLRYPALDSIPPGLSFDEAGNGVAAMDVAQGQYRLWWPIGGGKEPLIAYLLQPLFWLFGPTRLALRLYAATMGLITVAGTYWLARELFSPPPERDRESAFLIPLFAALGIATAFWHVALSRIAFRALAMPAIETLALAWLWRAMRSPDPFGGHAGRWRHFAGSGVLVGLSAYTYLTGRFVAVVLVLFFGVEAAVAWLRGERPLLVGQFRGLALAATVAILGFSPLALFFARDPAAFVERAGTVSIFNPDWNQGDLWGALLHTSLTTLGTFTALTGDPNPMGNLPGRPMLGLLLAPFFWLGVAVSLWQVIRHAMAKWRTTSGPKTRYSTLDAPLATPLPPTPYLLLLCWWLVMLLPGILAPEGAPHHLRIIGTAPATYTLVAVGLARVSERLRAMQAQVSANQRIRKRADRRVAWSVSLIRRLADSPILAFLIFLPIGLVTARDYFLHWAKQPELTMAYDVYAVELAEQMATETETGITYVIPMDLRAAHEARHYTLDFLYRGDAPFYYLPVDEATVAAKLTDAAAGQTALRVVRWTQDKHMAADEREVVTFLLATTARLVREETYPAYRIQTWDLPSTYTHFALPAIEKKVDVTFGGVLRLEAADVSVKEETVAVALRWAPLAAMDVDYKASLRLVAADGRVVAQQDRFLRHNWHQGTSLWPPETVNEYYLLSPAPPGEYEVRVVVYDPETLIPLVEDGYAEVSLGKVQIE